MGIVVDEVGEVAVFAIRGYYMNSMGKAGLNDRGIYDDAAWIILHDRCIAFNFNTDPTGYAHGRATLVPGIWRFTPGKHHLSSPPPKGRPAFRQFGMFTVKRDGVGERTGNFGINLHDGGDENTSSEGCQTVPASQWKEFKGTIQKVLGVTDADCMANPGGVKGKTFAYGLMEKSEADRILGRTI